MINKEMSKNDFMEIFHVGHDTMECLEEDIREGFHTGWLEIAYNHMVEDYLDCINMSLNEEEVSTEDVVDCILRMREDDKKFTMKEFVEIVGRINPECFK